MNTYKNKNENTISHEAKILLVKKLNGFLQILLNIASCFVFYLICELFPKIGIKILYFKSSIKNATHVFIVDQKESIKIYKIKKIKLKNEEILFIKTSSRTIMNFINNNYIKLIDTHYGRFVYDFKKSSFVLPSVQLVDNLNSFVDVDNTEKKYFLYKIQTNLKCILYGNNTIDMEIKDLFGILKENVIDFTFLWELFSLTVWFIGKYFKYFIFVFIIFLYLFVKNVVEDINENQRLRDLKVEEEKCKIIKIKNCENIFFNDSKQSIFKNTNVMFEEVNFKYVYPGDLILVTPTDIFRCDAEIVEGDVVVDESFLTGECVPVCKGVGDEIYAGTEVLKSNNGFSSKDQEVSIKNSITSSATGSNKRLSKLVKVKNLLRKENKELNLNKKTLEYSVKIYDYAVARIVNTGRRTKKGQLIKNMVIRNKVEDKFNNDTLKVLNIIFMLTLLVCVIAFFYLNRMLSLFKSFMFSFDIFTAIFSPTLAVCAEFGILKAVSSLKTYGILTNDKERVLIAGHTDTVVFDKTGTLTEIGLEVKCLDYITGSIYDSVTLLRKVSKEAESKTEMNFIILRIGMACCHHVIQLNGEYSGDVLDMKMFIFSNSKIKTEDNKKYIVFNEQENENEMLGENSEPVGFCQIKEYKGKKDLLSDDEYTLYFNESILNAHQSNQFCQRGETIKPKMEIIKIFDFNSKEKRMSVISKITNPACSGSKARYFVFCKGAPEILQESLNNVPEEYEETYKKHNITGYRTIALAYKEIEVIENKKDVLEMEEDKIREYLEGLKREEIEAGLNFISFLVFANNLKRETKDVISALKEANLEVKMCTGDSLLTAISVAKVGGIISAKIAIIYPFFVKNQDISNFEWGCVAEEEYIFDKNKLELYSEYDDCTEIDYVIAIESREYNELMKVEEYRNLIMKKGTIFARFSPSEKKNLVENILKEKDKKNKTKKVIFCGDGANDAGALCAATVGVLLSDGKNNLVSSFTTKELSSVCHLINEGKSALSLNMSQFKYILYSQLLAGFMLISTLIYFNFIADGQALIIDILTCYVLGDILLLFDRNKSDEYKNNAIKQNFKEKFLRENKCNLKISKNKVKINVFKHCTLLCIELLAIFAVFLVNTTFLIKPLQVLDPKDRTTNKMIEESNQATILFYVTMFALLNKVCYFANYREFNEKWYKNYKFLSVIGVIFVFLVFLLVDNICEFGLIYSHMDFMEITKFEGIVLFIDLCVVGFIINVFNVFVTNIEVE
ncbi:YPK9 [Ecytonucleospora hepatopenaei]|uniref:YPK9 n=1 Tax=Ecytonucleospora hepatopenaei TaxID=646526 RepID=A0A1W0E536_9MICR|nr:YPK9 [Ecytonucleospora hepatopenaei]